MPDLPEAQVEAEVQQDLLARSAEWIANSRAAFASELGLAAASGAGMLVAPEQARVGVILGLSSAALNFANRHFGERIADVYDGFVAPAFQNYWRSTTETAYMQTWNTYRARERYYEKRRNHFEAKAEEAEEKRRNYLSVPRYLR